MSPQLYQSQALRTAKDMGDKKSNLHHFFLGSFSEAGELGSMVKAHVFYGKSFDRSNAVEELGDICWFLTCSVHFIGDRLTTIMPDGTDEFQSISVRDNPNINSIRRDVLRHTSELGFATGSMLSSMNGYFNYEHTLTPSRTALVIRQIGSTFGTVACFADALGVSLSSVFISNIEKLRKRYPDKYSDENALARADKPIGD